MSQALYRTWRPALWEEVVGQDPIVQTLKNAIAADRVGHAYLFAGPKGTGKTTSARLLAKAVNCLDPDLNKRPCNHCANCLAVNEGRFLDLIEIDAASNTSVDDVRDLRDKINFSPSQGRYKVYIIDEVHMLSTSAFNALLKTLEEPPSHVIFVLATTEIHKIPATVLSRCQRFEFRRIPVSVIVEKLKVLCAREKITIDDQALQLIARQSTGSLRDAISLVDQLSSMNGTVSLSLVQDILGTATSQAVIDLTEAIISRSDAEGLRLIHQALDGGTDPRQFARQMVEYLRGLLLIRMNAGKELDLLGEVRTSMSQQAAQLSLSRLITIIDAFSDAAVDLKANWHPGLGLELAYVAAVTATDEAPRTASAPINHAANGAGSNRTSSSSNTPPATAIRRTSETKTTNPAPSRDALATPAKPIPAAAAPVEKPDPAGHSTPAAGDEVTLSSIHTQWDAIKRAVKAADPVAAALLSSARVKQADKGTLLLDFSSDLLRERMMEEKNLRLLRQVLLELTGQELQVSSTVGRRNQPDDPADDIVPNGVVDQTLRELHGKITKREKMKKDEE